MKRIPLLLCLVGVVTVLGGCEQAQQAVNAVDKAKTFTDDLQKNASKKLQDSLPNFVKTPAEKEGGGGSGEGGAGDDEKEEKRERRGKREKHD